MNSITTLIIVGAVMFTVLGLVSLLSHIKNINNLRLRRSARHRTLGKKRGNHQDI